MDKERRKTITNLLRKGGKMLAEPCYKCSGVLIEYNGIISCSNCDDIKDLEKVSITSLIDIKSRLNNLVSRKIEEVAVALEKESDIRKEEELSELLLKYLSILEKMSKNDKNNDTKEES